MLQTQLTAETVLPADGKLLMLGSLEQRQEFLDEFGERKGVGSREYANTRKGLIDACKGRLRPSRKALSARLARRKAAPYDPAL